MLCLFCAGSDKNYNTETGTDFICSRCVQILLSASQDDLKRAYIIVRDKGYTNKAKAIESFLDEEIFDHDRKTQQPKRNMVRKRPVRTVRPARNQIWA
jgi:hypothetical protein